MALMNYGTHNILKSSPFLLVVSLALRARPKRRHDYDCRSLSLAARGKVFLHSANAASRLAALLNAQILPCILAFRALRSGRILRLGATTDFYYGMLD